MDGGYEGMLVTCERQVTWYMQKRTTDEHAGFARTGVVARTWHHVNVSGILAIATYQCKWQLVKWIRRISLVRCSWFSGTHATHSIAFTSFCSQGNLAETAYAPHPGEIIRRTSTINYNRRNCLKKNFQLCYDWILFPIKSKIIVSFSSDGDFCFHFLLWLIRSKLLNKSRKRLYINFWDKYTDLPSSLLKLHKPPL